MAVIALAAMVWMAFPAARAEAAIPHLTATTVNCPLLTTYGTPATCTISVTDVTPLVTKAAPTGTVSIGTILDRLQVEGSPCTLVPVTSSRSECSVTVIPTDIGPILPGAVYSPTGDFVFSIGAGATAAAPAPLTITADDESRTYGADNPELGATYTGFVLDDDPSDLWGTLECGTTATVESPVGDYPIACDGQFSLRYYIEYVEGTLTVDPAPLTVTADDESRDYGAPNPAFDATVAGFVLGEGPEVLTGTLECGTTATTSSPVGTYPITCGGLSAENYDITWVPGTLAVGSVPLTITAEDAVRVAGTANPTITVDYDGFVDGDGPGSLSGTLECTTPATTDSPVGTYPITCGGLTSENYDITWVAGTLTVLAAPSANLPAGDEVAPGGKVEVDTEGWMPDSVVEVKVCGVPAGEIHVDGEGRAKATITVPDDLPAGHCELVLSGTDEAGEPYAVVLGLTLTRSAAPVTPSGVLPYTGAVIGTTTVLGIAVVAVGLGLHLMNRRRQLTPAVVRTEDRRQD